MASGKRHIDTTQMRMGRSPALSCTHYDEKVLALLTTVSRAYRKRANAEVWARLAQLGLEQSLRGQKVVPDELVTWAFHAMQHVKDLRYSSIHEDLRVPLERSSPVEFLAEHSWRPSKNESGEHLIIDFHVPWNISGVDTLGKDGDEKKAHVTEFLLKYSLDNITWNTVGNFKNCAFRNESPTRLSSEVRGRYFMFIVKSWAEEISLTAYLYGYPDYDEQFKYAIEEREEVKRTKKCVEEAVDKCTREFTGENKGYISRAYEYGGMVMDEFLYVASEIKAKNMLKKISSLEGSEFPSPPMWFMELSAPWGQRSFRCGADDDALNVSLTGVGPLAPGTPLREVLNAYEECRRVPDSSVGWLQWNDKEKLVHSKGFAFFNENGGIVVHHTIPIEDERIKHCTTNGYFVDADKKKGFAVLDGGNSFGQQFLCLKLKPESMNVFFECLQNIHVAIVEYRDKYTPPSEILKKYPMYPQYGELLQQMRTNTFKIPRQDDPIIWKELKAGGLTIEVALFGRQKSADLYNQFVKKYGKGGLLVCAWNPFSDKDSNTSKTRNTSNTSTTDDADKKIKTFPGCLLAQRFRIGNCYKPENIENLEMALVEASKVRYTLFAGMSEENHIVGLGDMNLSNCVHNRSGMFFVFKHAPAARGLVGLVPDEDVANFRASQKPIGGS